MSMVPCQKTGMESPGGSQVAPRRPAGWFCLSAETMPAGMPMSEATIMAMPVSSRVTGSRESMYSSNGNRGAPGDAQVAAQDAA